MPSTKEPRALDVIIIGGSIAGLMHGIMLARLGHNVRILERSASSDRETQAAGITAGPEVQTFLKENDRCHEPLFARAPSVKVLNAASKVRMHRKMDLRNTSWDVLHGRLRDIFQALAGANVSGSPNGSEELHGAAILEAGKLVTDVLDEGSRVVVVYRDLRDGAIQKSGADLVVAADGSSSSIRAKVLPEAELRRPYAGYLVWRGTVPEKDVSEELRKLLSPENTLFVTSQGYIVAYTIPGPAGALDPGNRLFNIAWYHNRPARELPAILTDVTGRQHHYSLPCGQMRDDVWAEQKRVARATLSPPFCELVHRIKKPFVAAVTDTRASRAALLGGKLLLVGDALTLFRPHVALSTNQAAVDCLLLRRCLVGEFDIAEWEARVLQYAQAGRLRSISWGAYFQAGWAAYLVSEAVLRAALVVHWLANVWHGRRA